jgi:hypothetical protein
MLADSSILRVSMSMSAASLALGIRISPTRSPLTSCLLAAFLFGRLIDSAPTRGTMGLRLS